MSAFQLKPIVEALRKNANSHSVVHMALGALMVGGAPASLAEVASNIDAISSYTSSTYNVGNKTHTITNNYQKGTLAVNAFNHFIVGTQDTANLMVPDAASKLVNIVYDKVEVHGLLQSFKTGVIGGDVLFASSQGFLVGQTGIINVGKLTLATPSGDFLDGLLDRNSSSVNDQSLQALQDGSFSISNSGLVRIEGKIVTAEGLVVQANQVQVTDSAHLINGNARMAVYQAAVNIGDASASQELQLDGGTLVITAAGQDLNSTDYAVDIAGHAFADGGIEISAATIRIADSGVLDSRNKDLLVASGNITLDARAEAEADPTSLLGGRASATTRIDIDGTIHGGDVSAQATSIATAEYTADDAAVCKDSEGDVACWFSISSPADTVLPLNNIEAHASALVKVSGAVYAEGDINLKAETEVKVANPGIGTHDDVLYAAPLVHGGMDANSAVEITKTATIETQGILSAVAFNNAELELSAKSAPPLEGESAQDIISYAFAKATVSSNAVIASGASIQAKNLVLVAENQSSFEVSANSGGAAFAFGLFDTDANAVLGADLGSTTQAMTGDVLVAAIDRVTKQKVESGAETVEAEEFFTVGSLSVGYLAQVKQRVQALIEEYAGDYSEDMAKESDKPAADGAQPGQGSSDGAAWEAGAAISLNMSEHKAAARIGNSEVGANAPKIYTEGQVAVIGQSDTNNLKTISTASLSIEKEENTSGGSGSTGGTGGSGSTGGSDSTAEKGSIGVSIATNVTVRDSQATADIGDGVIIEAANVGVAAQQNNLINNPWSEWDSFVDIIQGLKATKDENFGVDDVLTSFANATAGGKDAEMAFGGAFNIQVLSHKAKAWIGDGAYITVTGDNNWNSQYTINAKNAPKPGNLTGAINYEWSWDNAVQVDALNRTQSVNINGNMGKYLLKNGNNATEGDAIGGTIAYVQYDNDTVAGIGKARIDALNRDLGINARHEDLQVLVTPSSGKGKGVAFSGALAILNIHDYTSASLSNLAQVDAESVNVDATQLLSHWAAAGALALSNETAIGLAAAVTLSEAKVKAYIGDNSSDYVRIPSTATAANYTSPVSQTGIIADNLRVRGQSSGLVGAIAAAGAVAQEEKAPQPGAGGASEKKEPGLADKFKDFIKDPGEGLLGAFKDASDKDSESDTSIAGATKDGSTGEDSSASGSTGGGAPAADSTDQLKSAGLGASGALTVAVGNVDVSSYIDNAVIGARATESVAVDVQALNKTIQASAAGAAALVMNKRPSNSNSAALAGAIAYQISSNDTLAYIRDSAITRAGDIDVHALSSGQRVSVGLGVSANTSPSSGSGSSVSAAVSLSAAQVKDQTYAGIEGGTIIAADDSSNLDVAAYNNTDIGVGGGSVYAGGKTGVGLSVTFATIGNPNGKDAISAAIDSSVVSGFDRIGVTASNNNRIVLAAAGVGVQTAGEGQAVSLGGSFAVGDISTRTRALIKGGATIEANDLSVNALGTKNTDFNTLLNGIGNSNINEDFDFSGSSAYDKTGTHTSEEKNGNQVTYDSEGERIITIAGQVNIALGQNGGAGGIAYSHADIHTVREASINNANITLSNQADVIARNEALIYNAAVGVAVTQGSFAGVGSVGVSRINNQVIAEVGNWDAASNTSINAKSLFVDAQNRGQIISVAGGVSLNLGSGAAAGLAATVNLMGDRGGENGQITRARVGFTDLNLENLSVQSLSGTKNKRNQIIGNAIGVGIAAESLAFAGAVTVNSIDQSIEAGVKEIGGSGLQGNGNLSIGAEDNTFSVGTAWSIAGSGSGPAIGVAVVVNRAKDDVTAELLGGDSASFEVDNADITAYRSLQTLTLDAGVAVSDSVAIAPSVGTAYTDGYVLARIADGAELVAQNNVKVAAESTLLSHAASGAIGVGIEGGAGALAVSTVIDDSETFAYVDSAKVTALGKGTATTANSGVLAGSVDLADIANSDESQVDRKDLEQGFTTRSLVENVENAQGLIVNATSYNRMLAVELAGAGGLWAGVAINAATHAFNGETKAYIQNSQINQNQAIGSGSDVLVRSSAHNAALGITAGVAVGAGAAVAGLVLNLEDHDNSALIKDSIIKADTLELSANTTNLMQGIAVGAAVGGYAGAASVVTNKLDGDTSAWLTGGTTTANTVNVNASNQQETNAATGSAGIGAGAGVGIGLVINLASGDTRALIGKAPENTSGVQSTFIYADDVAVNAARSETIHGYAYGMGVDTSMAGLGLAGMLNLSDTTGETRAGVYDTTVRGQATMHTKADSVKINASEFFTAEQHAGALGVGGTGVGAAFNVVLNRTQTIAELVNSNTYADNLMVTALSDNDTFVTSVAGGVGAFGGAISLGYIRQGSGNGGAASGELESSLGNTNTVLASGNGVSNNHSLTQAERAKLNNQSNASIDVAASETEADAAGLEVEGTALLSGGKVTAARISGGVVNVNDLTVSSEGLTHNEILSGGVAVGLVGASGGLGIIRNYNQNIALVDAQVQASKISVNATEKDGANGHAGEVIAFSASGGGIAIGVAVSDVKTKNTVFAGVTQAVGDYSGDIVIHAEDTSSIRVGGDNENAPTNVTVALAAVGLSHASAEKTSQVNTVLGANNRVVSGYNNIGVDALVNGEVRSTAFTASAAYFGTAQGVMTRALDKSTAQVNLAGTINAKDNVVIDSNTFAQTYARSYGISVAGGVAIGVSDAKAEAATKSNIEVADSSVFAGDAEFKLKANTATAGSNYNADARAFAASGGLLTGAAAAQANASNNSQANVRLGDNITLSNNHFTVLANSDTSQYSDADGYFAGLLAVGANKASSSSNVLTKVLIGKNLQVAATALPVVRLGDLNLSATGTVTNQAHTVAGGGGAISGSASEAYTNTNGGSSVTLAGWNNNKLVEADGVQITSTYKTNFQSTADSVNASVIGLSGAVTGDSIATHSEVRLGDNIGFVANAIQIHSDNQADSLGDSKANSGAGGVITGSAALSNANAVMDSKVSLGKNNALLVMPGSAHTTLDHRLRLDASSRYDIFSSAQMKSGGAFQVGDAESNVKVVNNNSVVIGQGSLLENRAGAVDIGTQTRGNAWAKASVSVYGAAGLANATAKANTIVNNQVLFADNVSVTGLGGVEIYAGRSADHITTNALNSYANADVYNGTAFPLSTDPSASATATTNSLIELGNNVSITSVVDLWLQAVKGDMYATAEGRGRDLYDGIFSKERRSGTSKLAGEATISLGNDNHIEAGTRHQQSVNIDKNGNVTLGSSTLADITNIENYSSYNELAAAINELTAIRDALQIEQPTGQGVYKPVLDSNGNPIQAIDYVVVLDVDGNPIPVLDSDGVAIVDADGDPVYEMHDAPLFDADGQPIYIQEFKPTLAVPIENLPYIQEIDEQLAILEPQLLRLNNTDGAAILVANITASGGDVYLAADKITTHGISNVIANGDAEIQIKNESSKSLIVENLGIVNSEGGHVLITGAALNNLPITGLITTENTLNKGSLIRVEHDPDVGNLDVTVDAGSNVEARGLISNIGGTVDFHVARGDMLQTGTIEARQMMVYVPNGTYSLNTNSYQSFGFDPTSLRGYALANGWRPGSASGLVDWWINADNLTRINSEGIGNFNSWWYGIKPESRNFGASDIRSNTIHVYQNWGFSDVKECGAGPTCHRIGMKNGAGGADRGGDWWGFNKISDNRDKLHQTATYTDVKNAGYGAKSAPAVTARSIFINASHVDINGTIRAGVQNNWGITVGSDFDQVIDQYVAALGLGAGDIVKLKPNQILRIPGNYFENKPAQWLNPNISVSGGSNAIDLVYDVGTKQLRLADVEASGGGYVSIRGKMMSSSPAGKIVVDNGYGKINIDNKSTTELVVKNIDAGVNNVGVVRIQDLNKTGVDWFIHSQGDADGVAYYHSTNAAAASWQANELVHNTQNNKATFNTKLGQAYQWRESANVQRSYSAPSDGYWAKYPNTVGDWVYSDNQQNWKITSKGVVTNACNIAGFCNANGEVNDYMTQTIGTGHRSTSRGRYGFAYANYYGQAFVDMAPWTLEVATSLTLNATTTIKADHKIGIEFQGADQGEVTIKSQADVLLNGAIKNKDGDTSISSQGSIVSGNNALIDSKTIKLSASGNIANIDKPLHLITSDIVVNAGGLVNLDLSGQLDRPGAIASRFTVGEDLIVNSNRGLQASGNAVQLAANNVTISSGGGIQGFNTNIKGVLNLDAIGNIQLNQVQGDLLVGQVASQAGDITLAVPQGGLINAQHVEAYTAEQKAYLASVWDELNLKSQDAGKETVTSYENQVNSKYHQWGSLQLRLADADLDATARIALEQKKTLIEDFFASEKQAQRLSLDPTESAYVTNWTFAADATLSDTLTQGARWSDSALELVISASAFDGSGNVANRPANITGNNVTINVQADVGKDLADANYVINKAAPNLTDEFKVDLLNAGAGDIDFIDDVANGELIFTIRKQDPIKLNAAADLLVNAGGQIYLQSDQEVRLKGLHAGGDVRAVFNGDISSISGNSPTITANNLNLSSANGSIGSHNAPVIINVQGVLTNANASADIYLRSLANRLELGSVLAGGHLDLESQGNISHWQDNGVIYQVKADSASITAMNVSNQFFDIGSQAQAFNLELGSTLSLQANNAWIGLNSGHQSLTNVDLQGALELKTLGDLTLEGPIEVGEYLTLSAGAIDAAAAANVSVAKDVSIDATSVDLTQATISSTTGAFTLTTLGTASLGGLSTAENITLLVGDNLVLAGNTATQADFVAVAQGSTSIAEAVNVSAGGDLSSTSGANFLMGQSSQLLVGGDSRISAANIAVEENAIITSQDLSLKAANGQINLADNVNVTSQALTLHASDEISLAERVSLSVASLTANAARFFMAADAKLNSAADVAITSTASDIRLGEVDAGNLALTAAGNINLQSDVSARNNVRMTAENDTTLAQEIIVNVAGDFSSDSGSSWLMQQDSQLLTQGKLAVNAGKSITLGYVETQYNGDNAIVLNSEQSAILGRADSDLHVRATAADARGYFSSATGIGNPLVIDMPWLSAKTAQGDIQLISKNNLHAHLLDARNGRVEMENMGHLSIEELLGTTWILADGKITANRMTFDHADMRARDGIEVQSINMTKEGYIHAYAPTTTLRSVNANNTPLALTLTGINGVSAQWVAVNVVNSNQVVVDQLLTHAGAFNVPKSVSFKQALVRDKLDITTSLLSLRLDNVNQGAQDVDGQLVTPYGSFWADVNGNSLQTNALVSRYRLPMRLTYAGQNLQTDSVNNIAYFGISAEYLQNNAIQLKNVGVRERAPHWYQQVLSFINIDQGVSDEREASDALQQYENAIDENDYSFEITYQL